MSRGFAKRKRFVRWCIDMAIHDALAIARQRSVGSSFERLLAVVRGRSSMLRRLPPSGRPGWLEAFELLRGLLAVARPQHWLRPPENWLPDTTADGSWDTAGPRAQFESLVRHLLATHPVPRFMMGVWFEEASQQAQRHQKLFRHLARGNSIRGASLPIVLNRAMAQWFERAPHHLTVEQALRWSQIRAWGGGETLAAEVVATRLGQQFTDEAFWSRALRCWIARRRLDLTLIGPMVEFLHHHPQRWHLSLFQSSCRKRFAAFERQVRAWLEGQDDAADAGTSVWPQSGIGGFHETMGDGTPWSARYWSIHELTSRAQLIEEGEQMRHCVASYTAKCRKRCTSIWSLRRYGVLGSQRVLTIEVALPHRQIVTALGPRNAWPTPHELQVVHRWANQQQLQMSPWIAAHVRFRQRLLA